MSIQAKLRTWFKGEPRTIPSSDPRNGLWLHCEITHPPSRKGHNVFVHLTERDRDQLLLALRSESIRARRSPT